jgi:small-conductance mechanosensitive channel
MTGMSFSGLFVIILILISFSIIIAEEVRRKEEKRERTKMESVTIMVVGWGLIILAIPLTIYLFISSLGDLKQIFITILGALKFYR